MKGLLLACLIFLCQGHIYAKSGRIIIQDNELNEKILENSYVMELSEVPFGIQCLVKELKTLEKIIKYEAQHIDWPYRRSGWIAELDYNTKDINSINAKIKELEWRIKWEFQDDKWRSRRPGWINEINQSSSIMKTGQLMIEMESSILWEGQASSWRYERENWISRVQQCR